MHYHLDATRLTSRATIRRMAGAVESSSSTYDPAFDRIVVDVDDVNVVGHQAEGRTPEFGIRIASDNGESLEILLPVAIISKDIQTVVASRRHVVHGAFELQSHRP